MQAAVFHGPNDIRVVDDVPQPAARSGEVVIKVAACGVCGTDVRIFRGRKTRGVQSPRILGHEFAGEIVDVGTEVTQYKEGDRVAVAPVFPCHACYACRNGMENACEHRQAMGYEFDGAFAQYVVIPAIGVRGGHVFRIPDNLGFTEAALAEPLSCCINGQLKAGVALGGTVLVIGAGPIGLFHIQLARATGSRVIASEIQPNRREAATTVGATRVVDPSEEDLVAVAREMTGGLGVDSAILAIGRPELVNTALRCVRRGGTVNLFAGFSGDGISEVAANLIHYQEIRVVGTTASARIHYEMALKLLADGKVDAKRLITHTFTLSEMHRALQMAGSGAGLKVLVSPWGD